MTYVNLVMLLSTIPEYKTDKEKEDDGPAEEIGTKDLRDMMGL